VDHRQQRVLIETDRHRISGSITMPSGGFRSRLSDFLNHAEKEFIAVTDAAVAPIDGNGATERREFVVVGRQHIVLAMPEEAVAAGDERL
jgi:hypothetical protein